MHEFCLRWLRGGENSSKNYDIAKCKQAYINSSTYSVYSLSSAINDTQNFDKLAEEIKELQAKPNSGKDPLKSQITAKQKQHNAIQTKWDKKQSVRIKNQFIVDNGVKFSSSSFVAVDANNEQLYIINLKEGTDKYEPEWNGKFPARDEKGSIKFTSSEAKFIEHARSKGDKNGKYLLQTRTESGWVDAKDSNGKTISRSAGKFDGNYLLIQNKDANHPNRTDIVLGATGIPSNIYNWEKP